MTTKQEPRNLFATSTFWGIAVLLYQTVQPNLTDIINKGWNAERALGLVSAGLVAGWSITSRYSEDKNIYTPSIFPGRSKEQAAINAVEDVVGTVQQVISLAELMKNKVDRVD